MIFLVSYAIKFNIKFTVFITLEFLVTVISLMWYVYNIMLTSVCVLLSEISTCEFVYNCICCIVCIVLFLCVDILPIECIALKLPTFYLNYSFTLAVYLFFLSALSFGANCLAIVLSFIVSTPGVSMYNRPNNAGPLPGIIKNLHSF